jgi:hypothetical protein
MGKKGGGKDEQGQFQITWRYRLGGQDLIPLHTHWSPKGEFLGSPAASTMHAGKDLLPYQLNWSSALLTGYAACLPLSTNPGGRSFHLSPGESTRMGTPIDAESGGMKATIVNRSWHYCNVSTEQVRDLAGLLVGRHQDPSCPASNGRSHIARRPSANPLWPTRAGKGHGGKKRGAPSQAFGIAGRLSRKMGGCDVLVGKLGPLCHS